MNINTIIFDLDGTLLNTLEDLADSTNFALNSFGFPEKTVGQIRDYVGNGVAKLIERAIPNGENNDNFENCLALFKKNYGKNMYNKTAPYSGILEMLKTLKQKGLKIAVVSNKFDSAVKNLCEKYFPDLIDFAAGENEIAGIKKKPAPDTVLKAIEHFGAEKENSIYVGDSEVDIQTAKNAGIRCISVTWGFKTQEFLMKHGAKIIINNPDDIFKYL